MAWLGRYCYRRGITIYLTADRVYESRIDLLAASIVGKVIHDNKKAAEASCNALKKIRSLNLERRSQSLLSRLYLTRAGNNLLDFQNPLLTTRIKEMQEHLESFYPISSKCEPSALLPAR